MKPLPTFLDFSLKRLNSEIEFPLSDFYGQVILVVNTTSECMFTRQYQGLEELYERYRDRGFTILAIPSNDFGQQEPAAESEIVQFCEHRYGVTFPLFAKMHVKGKKAHPFFQRLFEKTASQPRWNFHKYLISRDGETVKAFSGLTFPSSRRLKHAIERMLDDPIQE